MARIGRKYKRKMQGTSSYASIKPPPSPSKTPSVKRQRLHYKRQGGADAALKKLSPPNLSRAEHHLIPASAMPSTITSFIDSTHPTKNTGQERKEQFPSSVITWNYHRTLAARSSAHFSIL